MIDGSIIGAHRHAAGGRRGQQYQALGRSCGGFSSKIHAKVNGLGMPLGFIVTAGQGSDIGQAQALVGQDRCDALIADRSYDSDAFRQMLISEQITSVISGRNNRLIQIEYDEHIYKERNAVERFFGRIKEHRRIATRYDKTALMFKAGLTLVAILIWLNLWRHNLASWIRY